jgi:valyl-tRNA synthetase
LQISQGYIIRILQHFATKLWNITNFVMLFQAVMKFLSRLVEIKILSITQVVNYIASSAGNSLAKIDKSIMNKKIGKNVNIIGYPTDP